MLCCPGTSLALRPVTLLRLPLQGFSLAVFWSPLPAPATLVFSHHELSFYMPRLQQSSPCGDFHNLCVHLSEPLPSWVCGLLRISPLGGRFPASRKLPSCRFYDSKALFSLRVGWVLLPAAPFRLSGQFSLAPFATLLHLFSEAHVIHNTHLFTQRQALYKLCLKLI